MSFELMLNEYLDTIEGASSLHQDAAAVRLDSLTKPQKSLGRIEELAIQLAGILGTDKPSVQDAAVMVCAGDHGVVSEGVTAFPQEVTMGMVANFAQEGAAINQLSNTLGVRVEVYDVGVASPTNEIPRIHQCKVQAGTANMRIQSAMTREQFCEAVWVGVNQATELIEQGIDIICLGEMGIGNSTAAAALTAALTGISVRDVVGRGAGLSDEQLLHKTAVIEEALRVNNADALDVIGKGAAVGGLEIAMMAGIVLACAKNKRPVVADGYISGSAVLLAAAMNQLAVDYVVFSHRSVEPGHQVMYKHLSVRPLFDLDMRLGEGTGAVLAIPLVRCACSIISGMATFEEAGL